MNENAKKITVVVVAVAAVVLAIFMGINFMGEPKLIPAGSMGNVPPGKGMKAQEKAEEQAAAAAKAGGAAAQAGGDPLAGNGPAPLTSGGGGPAGKDR